MKKIISVFTMAGIISFGLFAFMAFLISSDQVVITQVQPLDLIEIAQTPEDTKIEPFVRKQLEPPEPPPARESSKVTRQTIRCY